MNMFGKKSITTLMFFDVECVPGYESFEAMQSDNPSLAKEWEKRAKWLRDFKEVNKEMSDSELYREKAGLQAEFGRIVCISVGQIKYADDGTTGFAKTSYYGENEQEILEKFMSLVANIDQKANGFKWTGHNVKRFDIPYVIKRALIKGVQVPQAFQVHGKKPWELEFVDTIEIWGAGQWKESFTPLSLLCTSMGIPTPKDDIDGSEVANVFYDEKDYERIKTYCEKDIKAVANVMIAFTQDSTIKYIEY